MIDKNLIDFLLTLVFAFLIGLEVRVYRESFHKDDIESFGSVRTFTLSGILGLILFKISLFAFIAGFIILGILYALHYEEKLHHHKHSILLLLVLLLTFSIGALVSKFPIWLSGAVFVVIIFTLNKKQTLHLFSQKIDLNELETLGKMVLLSVVILPILPKTKLPYIDISPFKIWLIVVIVSAISYFGYILQKYIFADKGFFLTGIAGGAYSSTATTVVLASKSKEIGCINSITAGI
ncbi:MgtC/SapB family protein, partial [Caminibacter sp.]